MCVGVNREAGSSVHTCIVIVPDGIFFVGKKVITDKQLVSLSKYKVILLP